MESTKANKSFCSTQVLRLQSKPFFPANFDGLNETLLRYAHSQDHAERVIDEAMIRPFGEKDADRCPGPSDLWGLCREISQTRTAMVQASTGCPECHGSGWRVVDRGNGVSGAARCCGAGPGNTPAESIPPTVMREWRNQELAEAESRRRNFQRAKAPSAPIRSQMAMEITDADIEAIKAEQTRNRARA